MLAITPIVLNGFSASRKAADASLMIIGIEMKALCCISNTNTATSQS